MWGKSEQVEKGKKEGKEKEWKGRSREKTHRGKMGRKVEIKKKIGMEGKRMERYKEERRYKGKKGEVE